MLPNLSYSKIASAVPQRNLSGGSSQPPTSPLARGPPNLIPQNFQDNSSTGISTGISINPSDRSRQQSGPPTQISNIAASPYNVGSPQNYGNSHQIAHTYNSDLSDHFTSHFQNLGVSPYDQFQSNLGNLPEVSVATSPGVQIGNFVYGVNTMQDLIASSPQIASSPYTAPAQINLGHPMGSG